MSKTEPLSPDPAYGEVFPSDEHNERLLSNVHPRDWKNPEAAPRYNLVVIGAGTAGLVTAAGAAGLGAKVALIERHLLGGDCLNVGCVPSKALIRSSRVVADLLHTHEFGVHPSNGYEVRFPAIMERMRRLRAGISHHDSAHRFQKLGIDVFLGEAQFSGGGSIAVGGSTLRFKKAVIATGARAIVPPVEGLSEAGYLTNETVFSLTELPRRMAVIGGGPIACELSQAFCRFGCEVTVFERSGQLLKREDRDAAEILLRALLRERLQIKFNAQIARVVGSKGGKQIYFKTSGSENEELIEVDEILVGVGRAPNVEGLNLESVGVAYDQKKGVFVDDRLRTNNQRIYAVGDVCLSHKFTHVADATARLVIQNALFLGRKKLSHLTIPWCTYTDPEIAHVGISEKDAQEMGIPLNTFLIPMNSVDRAITDGEEEGFVKIHVERGSDTIKGATIVARHAGDMISEITLAMVNNIGLGGIATVIHPYPTQSEAIRKAADAYNRTRLTPFVKQLFTRWLTWTR